MPWEQSARSAVSRAFRIVINCFTTQFYCEHRDIDASMLCVRRCAVCIARIYRFHFTPPCVCVSDLVIHYNYAFYGFRRLLFFVLLIFLLYMLLWFLSLRLCVFSFIRLLWDESICRPCSMFICAHQMLLSGTITCNTTMFLPTQTTNLLCQERE